MVQLRAKIQNDRRYFWALVCFILVFAFILRLPYVSSGLPYFYHEDEAHHFNRVVRMTQKGEYNPEYFHKPSLHFYLRMPVVAASFLWSVKKGEIRSIQEVKTEDPYGLGDYNFTASHPRLVRWSRMLSVLLAVGLVAGAMKVSWLLIPAWPLMAATGLLTAVAPGLVSQSAVIGVDMPMAFFAILSVIFSLDFFRTKAYRYLFWAAVCAGLSTSSKYNALPICVLPLVTIVVSRALRWKNLVTSLLVPIGAFFAASPFILVSLPLFLDQFAYEIWHYGVAGHQGHMATPGFEQAGFYLNWIVADGVGLVGLFLAFLGALYFLLRLEREAVVAFSFSLLLFILMCLQKTNFTRNLLALLPFVSLLVVFGLFALVDISKRFVSEQRVPLVAGTFFLGVFFQPFLTASQVSMRALSLKDS
ncbi:MAG: hypothetical protein KDD62_13045, partial [Bdellovibrionales bacterium]|nr:hypothetical protein [Bdellovibrionales bacterium]